MRFDGERPIVLVYHPTRWDAALHEAIHALMGPASLEDEHALMAVEFAACSELCEPWRSEWRRNFADYGLQWELEDGIPHCEIGLRDDFTRSGAWVRGAGERPRIPASRAHGLGRWPVHCVG